MKILKYKKNKLLINGIVSLFLVSCNAGQSPEGQNTATSSAQNSVTSNSDSVSITPLISLNNSSMTNSNCSYYITWPNGEPHGQTPIIAASGIKPGNIAKWNYTDKFTDYDNGKPINANTKLAVCSYNQGWGFGGPGSEEGGYYMEHNPVNNTITFTGYGLPTSKTTVSCSNANGDVISKILVNDNYTEFTCYLTNKNANISISLSGKLNNGNHPLNQQIIESDHTSFTQGNNIESECMTDNNTGLMWVRNLNTVPIVGLSPGTAPNTTYLNAEASINAMNQTGFCGHNDWRLPSINEISSLINYTAQDPQQWLISKGFSNLANGDGDYWTQTSHVPNEEAPWSGYKWITMMSGSGKGRTAFAVGIYSAPVTQPQMLYVWPVRSTQITATTPIIQTGDNISTGKSWPASRFVVDNSGKCMIDTLTNLTWVKNQDNLKTIGGSKISANYVNAQATVSKMNHDAFCGITNWRLPTVRELSSLINYSQADFGTWLNSQGFNIHNAGQYWNSFWTGDIVAEPIAPGYPGRVWYMNSDGVKDIVKSREKAQEISRAESKKFYH